MKCPACQFENRDRVMFCEECGAKLELKCFDCGATIPIGRKFCGNCGFKLINVTESTTTDYSEMQSYTPKYLADKILTTPNTIEGERKILTVLFADVSNYTAMTEKLDPEDIHQIMDDCFKILMDKIHFWGGTINQFRGDCVMALFGGPVAHEDHAFRACKAALSIQKSLETYTDYLKTKRGIDFKMRIGLNSGEVVVGAIGNNLRMDYTADGDTTNIAARMEKKAEPGTILASRATYQMIKDYFVFHPMGELNLKGKARPQKAYKLIKSSVITTRIEASAIRGLTKFSERKESMAMLIDAFKKTKSGLNQVVGIMGEAGVGKSRLIVELRRNLMEFDFIFLEGRCMHHGHSIPYLPVIHILKSYFKIEEKDHELIIKRKILDKINILDKKLNNAIKPLHQILGLEIKDKAYLKLDLHQKKEKIFKPIRDLFAFQSKKKPLVIALDDIHWIDNSSEDFLEYLVRALADARVLLILLSRSGFNCQWESYKNYEKIELEQLSRAGCVEMVKAILKGRDIVNELLEFILTKAGGNPLFIEELTQSLLENHIIRISGNQYVIDLNPSELKVPDTIQGIITSRIDRLDESAKYILQVASVIGKEFSFAILQSILGKEFDLTTHLFILERSQLILNNEISQELKYIFKHALIQEVAYSSLLNKRKKELHEMTGNAIELTYSVNIYDYYETLAYQFRLSKIGRAHV